MTLPFKRVLLAGCIPVLVLSNSPLMAQADTWPAARARHHLAYDSGTGQVLLVGGTIPLSGSAHRDRALWGWDGASWRILSTEAPARANDAAAFDAVRGRLVLYGGSGRSSDGELDETWEWDGTTWQRAGASDSGPGPRAHHAMIYDPAHRLVLLFGNSDDAITNDTWGWDGSAWRQLARDGPPRRGVYGLAFDTRRGVAVLFGGYGSSSTPLNDTWEWNGQQWRRVETVEAPSPRWDTQMAYDSVRQTVVLFGGRSRAGNMGDTWEYDGEGWTRLDISGPAPRNGHAMIYDPRAGAILLFGGRDEPRHFDDLWKFDGAWRQVPGP